MHNQQLPPSQLPARAQPFARCSVAHDLLSSRNVLLLLLLLALAHRTGVARKK
jgi:hypothetical protein